MSRRQRNGPTPIESRNPYGIHYVLMNSHPSLAEGTRVSRANVQRMSIRRPFLLLCVLSGGALAQSAELLDAVRVHQPQVAQKAREALLACVAPKCRDGDRLALLTAQLELSDGDPAAAVKVLTPHRPPKGLEAFYGWYLGEAQAYAGQRSAALKTLRGARKGAPAWLDRKLELRVAELQLDLGQAAKARPVLEAAAAADPSPELLLDRALCRRATKDVAGANADLRTLLLKYPTHPHSAFALTTLEAQAPVTWTPEEELARAQSMLSHGDAAAALALSAHISLESLAQRVALLRGQALLARGKDSEALVELELAAHGASAAVAAEAMMTQARRLMRLGKNEEARAAFHALDLKFPRDLNADEAGYLHAWLAMNVGDDTTAAADFTSFEERHAFSKRRDEARWFRGFSLFRLGRQAEARGVLLSLAADFPKSSLVPQALYWATRSLQQLGSLDAGVGDAGVPDPAQEYQALIAGFGGSFYARLAIERLRELGVEPTDPFPTRPKQLIVKTPPSLALAAELSKTGLLRDAWEEVQRVVSTVSGADQALLVGHALQALGEFGPAHALAARYLWGPVYSQHAPEALALMYPRAWRSSVETSAEDHHIDPYFAWAIMRRESAFRPEVTSFADARGLMQLIPPTAKQIGLETKHPIADPDELYAPETNVRLGCAYLSALFARLEHPGLVAAAYNGGSVERQRAVRSMGRRDSLQGDARLRKAGRR
jgi:soluble lytic murein transglycosylase